MQDFFFRGEGFWNTDLHKVWSLLFSLSQIPKRKGYSKETVALIQKDPQRVAGLFCVENKAWLFFKKKKKAVFDSRKVGQNKW